VAQRRLHSYNVANLLLPNDISPPNPLSERRCRAVEPAVHAVGSGGLRLSKPDAGRERADAGQFRPADGELPADRPSKSHAVPRAHAQADAFAGQAGYACGDAFHRHRLRLVRCVARVRRINAESSSRFPPCLRHIATDSDTPLLFPPIAPELPSHRSAASCTRRCRSSHSGAFKCNPFHLAGGTRRVAPA